jgi:hypothetical protein
MKLESFLAHTNSQQFLIASRDLFWYPDIVAVEQLGCFCLELSCVEIDASFFRSI